MIEKPYTIEGISAILKVGTAFVHRILYIGKLKTMTQQGIDTYIAEHGEYLEKVLIQKE